MSLSDSEDGVVAYGTPVETLDEDEIPNKRPRLVEDQIVKDKQGRRRFHGAFTGGFSAGFFNTVGSLEGWAPSSFKSSKSKKQENFKQKPEDFMDEEDVSEFGIAPIVLKARQDYAIDNKVQGLAFPEVLTLGTYVLQDVLRHVRETVGIKLLKKMGWKPGQGVGPRLTKDEKKNSLKVRQKTYGCQLPPGTLEAEEIDSDSDSEWNDIQFAPSDYEPFLCEAKNNFCGLGYEGLDKRPVLSGNSYFKGDDNSNKRNKKFGFGSQAFGVGAFEDEDEDIYARDDLSSYNFFLGKDESADTNKLTDKNSFKPDGVLEGFALKAKTSYKKTYPLPMIPKEVKPHHNIRHSRFDQPSPNIREKFIGPKGNHEDRRKLLDQPSNEVLNAKREDLLAEKLISNVKISEIAFKPFSNNPEKQKRYEKYLKLTEIGRKELLSDLQPSTMTNWDKEREKAEFEKAVLLFRPLTGGMEDRFSIASQPDDLSDPLAVVQKYSDENDDRRKAAKMKMFGPITRRTEVWIPNPLLCKRFNIPQPESRHSQTSEKQRMTSKPHFSLFDSVQSVKVEKSIEKVEKPEVSSKENTNKEEAETPSAKDHNLIDLYKAIFLASDDEEKGSEEGNIRENLPHHKSEKKETSEEDISFEDKLINSRRNSSPPKGIFKNLDLEVLSGTEKRESSVPEEPRNNKVIDTEENADACVLPLNLVYGPQMPEKTTVRPSFFNSEIFQDRGVWVEKRKRTEKKHKKKDKKSKKVSHKPKRKHKHKR